MTYSVLKVPLNPNQPIIYCKIYLQTYRHDMTYSVLKVPLNSNQPTNPFAFLVLHLTSSVLRQQIGWEERSRNDRLLCQVRT